LPLEPAFLPGLGSLAVEDTLVDGPEGEDMSSEFQSIYNHHERTVIELVRTTGAARHPHMQGDILADVACVALNRLPPRYIRHEVDFAFYLSDKERANTERAISEAVDFAFEFVQARIAMRARS
jgi:hypothetical protein